MSEIYIRNCTIYDGTGSSPTSGNILIENDRIKAIGNLGNLEEVKTIDEPDLRHLPVSSIRILTLMENFLKILSMPIVFAKG